MVVLATSILHRHSGKVLFSRQFLPITKVRIDSLLQTFPKLIDEDSQHTFIETDQVRYVYQATEKLYVVLITNKSSNIMEDLDSLQLILKLIPDVAGSLMPEDILLKSFELIFALDEAFSMGMKEYTTLNNIHAATEMYSHAEEIHRMLKESQINAAKRLAKERAEELELSRRLKAETGEGLGLESEDHFSSEQATMEEEHLAGEADQTHASPEDASANYPGLVATSAARAVAAYTASVAASSTSKPTPEPETTVIPSRSIKGLSLLKASRKTDDFVAQLREEEKLEDTPMPVVSLQPAGGIDPALAAASAVVAAEAAKGPASTKTTVSIEEKVSLTLSRDGACEAYDVEGALKLVVFDPDEAKLALQLAGPLPAAWKCQFKPGMDRAKAQENILVQADPTKSYPLGTESATTLARWRGSLASGLAAPFNVNVWATTSAHRTSVSAEIYCETPGVNLQNVQVYFRSKGPESTIEIKEIDGSSTFFDGTHLIWRIATLDASANGRASIEFAIDAIPEDELFPLPVRFASERSLSGMAVTAAYNVETGAVIDLVQDTVVKC